MTTCARCGRELGGDTIHAGALLLDLDDSGDVSRSLLCRDYEDGSGKMVTGCVNLALSPKPLAAARRRK